MSQYVNISEALYRIEEIDEWLDQLENDYWQLTGLADDEDIAASQDCVEPEPNAEFRAACRSKAKNLRAEADSIAEERAALLKERRELKKLIDEEYEAECCWF